MYLVDDRENSCPLKTKVRAYDTLPEVEQFNKIMRDIYKDFCVKKLRRKLSIVYLFYYRKSTRKARTNKL